MIYSLKTLVLVSDDSQLLQSIVAFSEKNDFGIEKLKPVDKRKRN
jgi:hypothetical protein